MKQKHLLSLFLMMLLSAVPASSWAQYITDLVIAVGRDGKPQNELVNKRGYKTDGIDLNKGATGSQDVFMGWKSSDNLKEAITNIVVYATSNEKDAPGDTCTFDDGRLYRRAKDIMGISDDLNKDAGGDFLYLYYTREKPELGVVTDIIYEKTYGTGSNYISLVLNKKIQNLAANFNRNTDCTRIRYYLNKQVVVSDTVPRVAKEFKAEAMGGNLYKLTVPLGMDIDGKKYILADPKLNDSIYANINGREVLIASIGDINRNKDDFSKNWGCKYNPESTKVVAISNPKGNGAITEIDKIQFGYTAVEGNNADLRLMTLFFMLKDSTATISSFRFKGRGEIDYSGTENFRFDFSTIVNAPTAPEGMNTITVIDPVMDFNAGKPGSMDVAASQMVTVVPAGKMLWAGVWDSEEKKFMFAGNVANGMNQWAYKFDPQQTIKHYTLLLYGENRQTTDKGMSSNPGWFAIPFSVKPFHAMDSINVTAVKTIDEKGTFKQENHIQWTVRNVRQEDAFDTDYYLVQRAQLPDFSDAVTIESVPVSGADSTQLKTRIVSDLEDVGTYTVIDDLEGNDFNSVDPSNGSTLYYRVVRAVYDANWGEDLSGRFTKKSALELNNNLAGVKTIKVEKTKDFDLESTVKVRVELMGGKPETAKGEDAAIWDSKASIIIQRYSPAEEYDNGKDLVAKKIIINGEDVKWNNEKRIYYAEIEDIQTYPYTHYYYKASVDTTRSSYSIFANPVVATTATEAQSCYKETLAPVAHLEASMGTVKGRVVVEWEAEEGVLNGFKVERRKAAIKDGKVSAENDAPFTVVSRKDTLATSYVDDRAEAGVLYEYRISSQLKMRQQVLEAADTVYGWRSYYGTVRAKVTLKNNALMPDSVTVNIASQKNIQIATVLDANNDTIIPGYNQKYQASLKRANGMFEFEDVPYMPDSTTYEVTIVSGGANFELEGQMGNPLAVLHLNDEKYEYTTLHYICNDTRQFSGRVLYKNSTIPVRDCEFEMNGCPVVDASGNRIKTDSKGEFSFLLPSCNLTLRAVKDGHTFADDGYVLARESDKKKDDKYAFTPSADYDGLILTDNTTVRLVGRLIGGNKQGRLPLGMGLTKNNLGDNMRVVLELEGDNTSRITYFNDDPNRASYTESFSQAVTKLIGEKEQETQLDITNVTFEKKRIVIEPNVRTGEFCIDLAPTKYKITEMSVTGYSTLFNEGEGFQVLDLSHSDTCLFTDSYTILDDKMHAQETRTTTYNAKYNRIVHNPVTITYEQYRYGMKQNFLGAEKMAIYNVAGEKKSIKVATYDKAKKELSYMFGHPVFVSGEDYELHVYAHEDYYYNCKTDTVPDVVYLEGDTLLVNNGLVSAVNSEIYPLDNDGHAIVSFRAANPEFSLNRKDALRYLNMQVKSNGYYFKANPVEAFVTGIRNKGYDVMPYASVDGPINVVDVIRDPYGARSYTYREKGTNYHWDYSLSVDFGLSFDIKMDLGTYGSYVTGAWTGAGGGAFAGIPSSSSSWGSIDIPIPVGDVSYTSSGTYDKTLNDRISTSSDPLDVGAMADVYCGFTDTYNVYRMETFSVIDSTTYRLVKPAIESGAIRIIQEGKDGNYLAISEQLQLGKGKQKEFVYTQKHILGTILPQLEQKLMEIVLFDKDSIEIQKQANIGNKLLYWLKSGDNVKDTALCIVPIYPRDENGKMLPDYSAPVMTPEGILETINQWCEVIATNEQQKLKAITEGKPHNSYSLSSASKIEHSESATAFWKDGATTGHLFGISIGGGYGWSWRNSLGAKTNNLLSSVLKAKGGAYSKAESGTGYEPKQGDEPAEEVTQSVTVSGAKILVHFIPEPKFNFNRDKKKKHTRSAGSGYVLETTSNSYMDIDVYQCDDYKLDENFINTFKKADSDDSSSEYAEDFWETVTEGNASTISEAKFHDFVFTVRGGAERNPWYEPDSTICYIDTVSMKGFPLTRRTLRIDNPKITISNPVVSNIPVGDKAIFSVTLTNESEVTTNMDKDLMDLSIFKLFLDEKSCPDGLAITMDGMPLTDGREFRLKPGESITKTIQVERAGKQYNYENVRLGFRDEANSLFDYASISINYLPASTPVKMVRPVDKWVMNTLSAKDNEGKYYLPIEVNGFNTEYDNFDHIELQYKKKTEGDSKWVNMCSFYANKELYDAASGTKEMLETGTINYRFYGEADPIEMEYDLRAVSFCRLGTGYVTAVSNVMSGLKDTRNPEIFGKPKPTNGVLTFEDVISFPFNEPIAYNYLDKTANFQITGLTNNLNNVYDTALRFSDYSASDAPASKVKRSLAGQDFTWEAMVKLDGEGRVDELFSIYDTDISKNNTSRYFTLMYDSCALVATMDGVVFNSKKLTNDLNESMKSKLTNVAVSFTNDHVGIKKQMRFYVNGTEIEMDKVQRLDSINFTDGKDALVEVNQDYHITSNVYGRIFLGSYMKGLMVDARLWDKAMSGAELASKRMKVLNGSEPSLLCYWPMDEMTGNVLHDKVNGTDLHFSRQTWQMPDGQHSLRLNGEGIKLKTQDTDFMRAEYNDFTLSFWTQIDSVQTKADTVSIFNAGSKADSQHFAIYMDKENVNVKSGEFCQSFAGRSELADNMWHLVTAVTNKSNNTSSVYLDGKLMMIAGGDDFKGMPSSVSIGDENFHGNFDCISFWQLAVPSNSLTTVSNVAPTGREMGLSFYMPFEKDSVNSQGTHQSVFCPDNMVVKKDENGKELSTHDCALPDDVLSKKEQLDNQDSYPPVRSYGIIQNIPFTWTATNNELQINLNKRDAEINHQYVNVTVRDVEDLAGNTLLNPQMMRVYVDRNVLNWDDSKVDINVKYGEPATITRKLNNKSGRKIYYTLENNCTWLKLQETSGEATPLNYDEIEMEVSDGLAPGEYYTTVYAVDEDNLSSPLTVSVNVTADEPEWIVTDAQDYNYTMNIMGRVQLKNEGGRYYFDIDKRDIVAAFFNGVCVGKTNISVADVSNPMVNLTVLGNKDMDKKNLTFLLWNAATNTTSVIVPNTGHIAFENGAIVGCPPAEPVIFTTTNEKSQTWNLDAGWNWVSLYIKPKNTDINQLFESNSGFSAGDVIMVNGKASEVVVNTKPDGSKVNSWSSGVTANGKYTFQIYVHNPVKATVYGYEFRDADRYVTLNAAPKNGAVWCHLPYLLNVDQPINVAMSALADNAPDKVGTVIKDRKKFAVLNKDQKWVGSLDYMHPGDGYFVKYFGNDTLKVEFHNTEKTAYAKQMSWSDGEDDVIVSANAPYAGITTSEACSMMPVIAAIADDADFEEGDEIVAFTKGNAISSAKVTELEDGKKLFFISLNAEDGNIVRFAHVRGNEVIAKSCNSIVYDGNAVTGTLDVPYTIDFSSNASNNDDAFGIGGEKYGKAEDIKYRKGIFIIGNEKIAK